MAPTYNCYICKKTFTSGYFMLFKDDEKTVFYTKLEAVLQFDLLDVNSTDRVCSSCANTVKSIAPKLEKIIKGVKSRTTGIVNESFFSSPETPQKSDTGKRGFSGDTTPLTTSKRPTTLPLDSPECSTPFTTPFNSCFSSSPFRSPDMATTPDSSSGTSIQSTNTPSGTITKLWAPDTPSSTFPTDHFHNYELVDIDAIREHKTEVCNALYSGYSMPPKKLPRL